MSPIEELTAIAADIASAEKQIDETEKKLAVAREHRINNLLPWRRRNLNKVESDIAEQREMMTAAKQYLETVAQIRSTHPS